MDVYIAYHENQNTDTVIRAFYNRDEAIEWATEIATAACVDPRGIDAEDHGDKCVPVFTAYYSNEGDVVNVVKAKVEGA